jgi:TfoX/Sxy family transcriptional regulator of competence genes
MPKAPMPRFTPAPPELTRQFQAALSSVPGAEPRKMFGYLAGFIGGNMFAGIFQDSIVLWLPSADRAELLDERGARPFEPMPGRVMREYAVMPKSLLEEPGQLAAWLMRARAHVAKLPAKPGKPARKPRPARKRGRGLSPEAAARFLTAARSATRLLNQTRNQKPETRNQSGLLLVSGFLHFVGLRRSRASLLNIGYVLHVSLIFKPETRKGRFWFLVSGFLVSGFPVSGLYDSTV